MVALGGLGTPFKNMFSKLSTKALETLIHLAFCFHTLESRTTTIERRFAGQKALIQIICRIFFYSPY